MTSSFEKKNKNKNKKIPRNRRPGVVNFSLDAVPFNKKKGNRCWKRFKNKNLAERPARSHVEKKMTNNREIKKKNLGETRTKKRNNFWWMASAERRRQGGGPAAAVGGRMGGVIGDFGAHVNLMAANSGDKSVVGR